MTKKTTVQIIFDDDELTGFEKVMKEFYGVKTRTEMIRLMVKEKLDILAERTNAD